VAVIRVNLPTRISSLTAAVFYVVGGSVAIARAAGDHSRDASGLDGHGPCFRPGLKRAKYDVAAAESAGRWTVWLGRLKTTNPS
jgi:hypothetical protein